MPPLRHALAALACLLPLLALAQDDEAAIVASSRWSEAVGKTLAAAGTPEEKARVRVACEAEIAQIKAGKLPARTGACAASLDDSRLRAACHDALARPRAAGETAADACIGAAVTAVDPQAHYFSPAETRDLRQPANPGWVGIGVELVDRKPGGPLQVARPLPDGPGARMGLKRGDFIVRIDGAEVAPLTMDQAAQLLRGEDGSRIKLDVERGAARERHLFVSQRARARDLSAWREALTPAVAALRVRRFNDGTLAEWNAQVEQILQSPQGAPDALVIDLRGNGGGLLASMLQTAGAISGDTAVVAHLVTATDDTPLAGELVKDAVTRDARKWLRRVRLVVLVDEATANGAEAFALFLREQRGARLVGQRTFGRAAVDTIVPLTGQAALRVRSGELRSSKGAAWDGVGITPDVVLPATPAGTLAVDDASADDAMFAAAMAAAR